MFINLFSGGTQGEITFMRDLAYCFYPSFCRLQGRVTHEEHMSILAFLGRLMDGSMEMRDMAFDVGAVDVEADAIIRAFFKRNPDAAYRMTKLAMALAARPEPPAAEPAPSKPRGWLTAWLERRDQVAS